jgi:uncharacterized OB-fold protein
MASRCTECGHESFPPRADCTRCRGGSFEFIERSGRSTLVTHTRIDAAPAGFEGVAPFRVGVVDLEEGGRALAWFGESVDVERVEIGMPLQITPRIFDEVEEIKIYYTLEGNP